MARFSGSLITCIPRNTIVYDQNEGRIVIDVHIKNVDLRSGEYRLAVYVPNVSSPYFTLSVNSSMERIDMGATWLPSQPDNGIRDITIALENYDGSKWVKVDEVSVPILYAGVGMMIYIHDENGNDIDTKVTVRILDQKNLVVSEGWGPIVIPSSGIDFESTLVEVSQAKDSKGYFRYWLTTASTVVSMFSGKETPYEVMLPKVKYVIVKLTITSEAYKKLFLMAKQVYFINTVLDAIVGLAAAKLLWAGISKVQSLGLPVKDAYFDSNGNLIVEVYEDEAVSIPLWVILVIVVAGIVATVIVSNAVSSTARSLSIITDSEVRAEALKVLDTLSKKCSDEYGTGTKEFWDCVNKAQDIVQSIAGTPISQPVTGGLNWNDIIKVIIMVIVISAIASAVYYLTRR